MDTGEKKKKRKSGREFALCCKTSAAHSALYGLTGLGLPHKSTREHMVYVYACLGASIVVKGSTTQQYYSSRSTKTLQPPVARPTRGQSLFLRCRGRRKNGRCVPTARAVTDAPARAREAGQLVQNNMARDSERGRAFQENEPAFSFHSHQPPAHETGQGHTGGELWRQEDCGRRPTQRRLAADEGGEG